MQRRATANTRAPNAAEKRFMSWVKEQCCIICFDSPPSIVDHCQGATWRHNKVLCGMWYLLPYCPAHDQVKTLGSSRAHFREFGFTQSSLWLRFIHRYPERSEIPEEVITAIRHWGK